MMTETEALAACLAVVLAGKPATFGKEHAEKAVSHATKLLGAQRIDAGTFSRVVARLGNHSQVRQWATAHGFIAVQADALETAVSEAIAKVQEQEAEALKSIGQP